MGLSKSQPQQQKFVHVTNDSVDLLEFNPSQSHLVSYGIEHQSSPKFKSETLGLITGSDAKLVCNSFIDIGAFPAQNTVVYVSSKQAEECSFDGIKKTFQDCAARVGPDGLLVFHFSGHSIKIQNEWGLAPVDFASSSTYLTASVLVSWINEIKCQAKYILFTFDCCHAGEIGTEMMKLIEVQVNPNIYCVISACAGNEELDDFIPLENSIFAYFLSDAILHCRLEAGLLPIKKILSRCHACCKSFSSLIVEKTIQPQLIALPCENISFQDPQPGALTLQQVGTRIGRFSFAQRYNLNWTCPRLSKKSYTYLETVSNMEEGPLLQLEENGVLSQRVLNAIICSMMYSVAATEVVSNPGNVQNPNLSIAAFMNCVAAIDTIHSGVEFDKQAIYVSWLFYQKAFINNKTNSTCLQPLLDSFTSTESADFAAVSVVLFLIFLLCFSVGVFHVH